jgi:hypothetical protein
LKGEGGGVSADGEAGQVVEQHAERTALADEGENTSRTAALQGGCCTGTQRC